MPDTRYGSNHRNIIINIMIVFLSHSVHVHTIIKEGYLPMHEHTMMHEVPTFLLNIM